MSTHVEKLKFPALVMDGSNYITWTTHMRNHLKALGLGETITDEFNHSDCEMKAAKALVLILHHLSTELQQHFLMEDNPATIWKSLKSRFDNKRNILRPLAIHEWNHLRFQDFKTVAEYNNELYKVATKLRICGLEVLSIQTESSRRTTSVAQNSNGSHAPT